MDLPPSGVRERWIIALLLGFLASLLVLLTASDYGIASDAGNYFESSLLQLEWAAEAIRNLLAGQPRLSFGQAELFEHWRWSLARIPHPPLSRELGGLTYVVSGGLLPMLTAYRLAVILAYGALVASAYVVTQRATHTRVGGLAASAMLLTVPALFAYGHLALTDLFLAAFWFWTMAALEKHLRGGGAAWLWGVGLLAGAAAATKFTGLLLAPAILIWLLVRRMLSVRRVAVILAGAVALFFAVNPVLWVAPLTGLGDYLSAGFGRSGTPETQITTEYFGRVFSYRPPWHYPYVWLAIVVPIPWLLAVATGFASWRKGRLVAWAGVSIFVMFGALMLPSAPLHDGIRLFLPVFPFLAVLGGHGVVRVSRWLEGRLVGRVTPDFVRAVVLLGFLALPALRTVQYHPHQLSYFNALIGGVRGAEKRGLEVTGLKEAFNPAVLADLEDYIRPGQVVGAGFLMEEMCFYRGSEGVGKLWTLESALNMAGSGPSTLTCDPERRFAATILPRRALEPDYVFVLNRPGQFMEIEKALTMFGGEPFYRVDVQGVPVLEVYRTR